MIGIPQNIYTDDKACGEFIIEINERLSKLAEAEKALKEAKEVATNLMLTRLEATGLKHFAFDFGTFARRTKTQISFPTAEKGGKEKAVEWLSQVLERGLIDLEDLMNIQQARVVSDTVLALEEIVQRYNTEQAMVNPNFVPLPESPFNKYEQVTLSTPRKRKD